MPAKKNIQDVLGAGPEDESFMSKDAQEQLRNGVGVGDESGNPLEAMDQMSKKKDQKAQGSKLDEEEIIRMMKTGDNTEGMFTPKEEKEIDGMKVHEEEDEAAKMKVKGNAKPTGKYEKQFQTDILKHPNDYKINTPKGEMTVSEAIQKGYNPLTKRFEKNRSVEDIKQKHLSQLNDTDKMSVEKLMDPSSAQVAPADAEKYGLKPDSNMIKKPMNPMMPEAESALPQAAPEMGATGNPIGTPMPGAEQTPTAPGGMDLSALLGGKA